MFKWLFGKKKSKKVSSSTRKNVRIVVDGMMQIDSEDMFGPYSKSQNGKYSLLLCDSDPSKGRGGYRDSGNGRFALISGEEVRFIGECERPVEGAVSNSGAFAIIDTHFGSGTESTMLAFSSEGKPLYKHRFTANSFGIGISETGKYVVVQSANSKTDDSGKLHLIDTENQQKVSSFEPKTGWCKDWSVNEELQRIIVSNNNNRSYEYDFSGELQNPEKYDAESIEDASPEQLVIIVQEKLKNAQTSEVSSLIDLINSALERGLNNFHDYRPLAYRLRGEANEKIGETNKAIQDYRSALEIDPKIGVKRKLQKLERSVQK